MERFRFMMFRKVLGLFFLLVSLGIQGQSFQDAGTWISGQASLNLPNNVEAYLNPEIRIMENFTSMSQLYTDLGVQQSWGKHWSGQGEYRIGVKNYYTSLQSRQRISLGVGFDASQGDWKVGIVTRQQWGTGLITVSDISEVDVKTTFRCKGQVRYKLNKQVQLGQSIEGFFNSYTAAYTNWRYQGFAIWDLPKKQSLKTGYMIQKNVVSGELNYVVTVSWSGIFKFRKKESSGPSEKKES